MLTRSQESHISPILKQKKERDNIAESSTAASSSMASKNSHNVNDCWDDDESDAENSVRDHGHHSSCDDNHYSADDEPEDNTQVDQQSAAIETDDDEHIIFRVKESSLYYYSENGDQIFMGATNKGALICGVNSAIDSDGIESINMGQYSTSITSGTCSDGNGNKVTFRDLKFKLEGSVKLTPSS